MYTLVDLLQYLAKMEYLKKLKELELSSLKDFMFIFSFSAADWSRTKSFKCSMPTLLQKRTSNSSFKPFLDFLFWTTMLVTKITQLTFENCHQDQSGLIIGSIDFVETIIYSFVNGFPFRSPLRLYLKLELEAGPYVWFYHSLVVGRAISSAVFSKNSKTSYTNAQNVRKKFFIRAIFNW